MLDAPSESGSVRWTHLRYKGSKVDLALTRERRSNMRYQGRHRLLDHSQ